MEDQQMITCPDCKAKIPLDEAFRHQMEATILKEERQKFESVLAKARSDATLEAKKEAESALEIARKQFTGDIELAKKEADAELEIARKKLEAETAAIHKKYEAEQELAVKNLEAENLIEKESNKELRKQLGEIMQSLREEKAAKENAELEAQKRLSQEADKIREDATKTADDRYRLKLAESEKKLVDTQKALEEAQRKAAQGSQQLQGEVMELDFEDALTHAFRDDGIEPVAKGVKGGDIKHQVNSQLGTSCGVILWEIKRTKNWTDSWIIKVKQDLRAEKANIAIIVTQVMPKQISEDMGFIDGVWVCKPHLALILATLLRKSLLDVGRQKALAKNQGTKADSLYGLVTSHEFVQQIESMVETYRDMSEQVTKERVAYERIWAQREKQVKGLLLNTANIIGSIQGEIGQASMPRIKGLELIESGDESSLDI